MHEIRRLATRAADLLRSKSGIQIRIQAGDTSDCYSLHCHLLAAFNRRSLRWHCARFVNGSTYTMENASRVDVLRGGVRLGSYDAELTGRRPVEDLD